MRLIIFLTLTLSTFADIKIPHPNNPIFNMNEIMNASTLETEIIQDWHLVNGPIKTRQKYVIINVGEFWPGQDYRVPLRFVVPANQKAKGFHLTGGNRMEGLSKDFRPRGVDLELLKNGVGLVMTIVQEFGTGEKKRSVMKVKNVLQKA